MADPPRGLARTVGNVEHRRDPATHELEPRRQPVVRAPGEDDDGVHGARGILAREDEQVGGGGEKGGDGREGDEQPSH